MDELERYDPELEMLKGNKSDGYEYRKRREEDWFENYTLSRDKVIINRLTQRQSVNFPLMKTVLRTLLKDVDDMPNLYFENLDNDKQAEIFKNEYWRITGEQNKFEILDIIDKRQVFHFGRSVDQWQIVDGKVKMTIQDPQDILVSRFCDPSDIHSSRFLIHQHIFKTIDELEQDDKYDKEAIEKIRQFYRTDEGIKKAADNFNTLNEKNKKMREMGVEDIDDPILGETYVELSMHFVFRREAGEEKDQIYLYVECDEREILFKEKLEKVFGETKDHFWRNHYPYNTWADDIERQDFWSDGVADIVRTPNKVVNIWLSQLVESRTLASMGMHYFDSSLEGFQPQTYEPRAWGWYGIPVGEGKKLGDVIQKVEIPDLKNSIDEMNFVIGMVEKASGATTTQQGVETERSITLGEVELALGEAKERIKGMSKFYTQVWKERGLMFIKLIEAGSDRLDMVKIYKKGRNTDNIYMREIEPKDWMTENGYQCRVWSQAERAEKNTQQLEKLNAVKTNMPDNPVVDEEYKRNLLEFADFSPDKLTAAMEYENQKRQMMMQAASVGMPGVDPSTGLPLPGGTPGMLPEPQKQISAKVA